MPLYDKDGKEVEGAMTKEEVEKAVSDAEQSLIDSAAEDVASKEKKDKEDADAKAAADQKAIDDKAAADKAAAEGNGGKPVTDPSVLSRLERIEQEKLADIHAGTDPEKRAAFLGKYGRLTGYPDTAEGITERAEDAVKMAFGTTPSIDVSADAGSGRNVDAKIEIKKTEADVALGKVFGITDADREKFAPKEETK